MAQSLGITIEKSYSGNPLIPNLVTRKAIKESIEGKNLKSYSSVNSLMTDLGYNRQEVDNLLRIKSDMQDGKRNKVEMSNFWD